MNHQNNSKSGKRPLIRKKQIAEDLKSRKQKQRVSPADEFEALAYSLTAGKCSDYDRARAESYLKAAHVLRREESEVNREAAGLADQVPAWAKLRKIQINPLQILNLAQGRGRLISLTRQI
ncbi:MULTISPECIES: hypothetical protein [Klebsiella]|uniref:hypothetical protein n=1 Tax=Klebsiella TaxID=570 RepID=UPI001CD30B0C|nr:MULTISPECIES: hypothetical protein [Klebsiella]MCE7345214.1 hypothetical protein [Klebsiella pneumoniae]MDM9302384.1 hypothetical protein [Klebsiella quasipneumoniae subsp. similipneumoniae]MDW1448328.1 hypothetical protein [Klebsiella pneumoniae]